MSRKDEIYSPALKEKKIPILTLDNKWHRLFTQTNPNKTILRLEEELNDLLKKQGKATTESKDIRRLKKKLMQEIVENAEGTAEGNNQKALKKMEDNKRLINECNERLTMYEDQLIELPGEIDRVNRELMLQTVIDDREVIEEWLSKRKGQKVYLRVPKRGTKEKLVELAEKNAMIVLTQDREKIKREEGRTIGAVKELADLLSLPRERVQRLEAYDISNTNGFESVGSMVVYEKGRPSRSDYRKFKLRTVVGPDDYASMHEVLTRRFEHGLKEREERRERELEDEYGSFTRFPDLILMDGGRGQVNIALQVLDELHLNIPVCGMVKDDNHRTRGLYYNNVEVPIDRHSEAFRLITRIQDEAHRFAIEYHRSLRSKEQVHSVLDDIPGIGPARRKALMRTFQSLDAIRAASVEELAAADSMNERSAQAVYDFFRAQEQ